ncbi:leucine-rich repeat domain-containing protein [Ruminococcus sp.]|uniref:leucine-rich repeat domain-containing protein n=1 Tax=Ruminococcus sp. TaxID=41978 RepID=UPI0025E1AA7B|nr:leucine-rich repeat domain-containing protein [Ruminococcus sp.]MBQ8965258.1 leucine-rich repeat domain-containing protein [Ruminococcus sp.]
MTEIENGILIQYQEDGYECYTVPDGVTEIADSAFLGAGKLKKVMLPLSLKKIGEDAFMWSGVTEVHIPSGVEEICESAFRGCKDLVKVTFDEGVRTIEEYAFFDCKRLKEIVLPESLKTIGSAAFRDCESLTDVVISEGTQSIGNGAFLFCGNLRRIVLPATLSKIEPAAFANCSSLDTVILNEESPYFALRDGMIFDKDMKKLVYCSAANRTASLPDTLEEIGGYAFAGCGKLEALELPASLKRVCSYAFRGTSSLKEIHIPEGLEFEGDPEFARDTCIHVSGKLGEMTFYPRETPMNECFILALQREYSVILDHGIKYDLILRMYFAGIEGAAEYVKKNFSKMINDLIDKADVRKLQQLLDMGEMVTKRNIKRLLERSESCRPVHELFLAYNDKLSQK